MSKRKKLIISEKTRRKEILKENSKNQKIHTFKRTNLMKSTIINVIVKEKCK